MNKHSFYQSLVIRAVVLIVIVILGLTAVAIFEQTTDPQIATNLALQTVNGGDAELTAQRSYETGRRWVRDSAAVIVLLSACLLFLRPILFLTSTPSKKVPR